MVSGDLQSNPLANQLAGNAIESLMNKFNLNQGQAGNIVDSLLPAVLQKFFSRTNDPGDNSFDLQGMLSRVTQGGLDRDGDGDTDRQDIITMIKGGAVEQQQQGGSGMMDLVKGLFSR